MVSAAMVRGEWFSTALVAIRLPATAVRAAITIARMPLAHIVTPVVIALRAVVIITIVCRQTVAARLPIHIIFTAARLPATHG
jgi:hypothetical protein